MTATPQDAHDAHDHHHPMPGQGKAFGIGIALNLSFVIIEAYYGWASNSLALWADAAHNLGDVGGLILAWAAFAAARIKPDDRHTYGWRRGSILASFINAALLPLLHHLMLMSGKIARCSNSIHNAPP
jgi:cobalt-zinc-cadmium efflux system protein